MIGYPDIDAVQGLIADMELVVADEKCGAGVRYALGVLVSEGETPTTAFPLASLAVPTLGSLAVSMGVPVR